MWEEQADGVGGESGRRYQPLVARAHRYTVRERMAADGSVLLPVDPQCLAEIVRSVRDGKYQSVAIGFIHAYANGGHEREVAGALRAACPGLSISLSSVVSPLMREFERFTTVVANAYVRPQVASYLDRLVDRLGKAGITAPVYPMHSGGGLISVETASEQPVCLLESGPAGDIHSLVACNAAGNRRLQEMMDEFGLDDTAALSYYVIETSRRATLDAIARVTDGVYANRMTVDGYDEPVDMAVTVHIAGERLVADAAGAGGMSRFGVNVPEVYTRAYACYALKCAMAPDVPNNFGALEPFRVTAPEGCILAARRPAPVSIRHVLGRLVPDVVFGALHQAMPNSIPAEGASALWNVQISARPRRGGEGSAEVLMFNSGGTGARPTLDGLSATAFPSGVKTISIEAAEHAGPIVVWRKELREGSGGPGRFRGGLGQVIAQEKA